MDEIVKKVLLAVDKSMPEMHLKPTGFAYSARGLLAKIKEGIQKFIQAENTNYIYKSHLYKTCFLHNIAYGKYKDLPKRTGSNKVLKDKNFKIDSSSKYD